ARLVSRWHDASTGERHLLSLLRGHRMKRLLSRMLDDRSFLSDFGVRSLSKYYGEYPYVVERSGHRFEVRYVPGDSISGMFGGNSNCGGPIWMPVIFLIIESLRRFTAITATISRSNVRPLRAGCFILTKWPTSLPGVCAGFFYATRKAAGPCLETHASSRRMSTSTIMCCFMSIFTATPAAGSAPRTRPGGPRWLRCC